MRVLLPLTLLPLLFLPVLSSPTQQTLHDSHQPPLLVPTTLIDVLAQSPNHTTLMRLLQRTKLIPAFNLLNNSAFFAPDNEAIRREVERARNADTIGGSLWEELLWEADEGSGGGRDNIQYALRQHLLYHLIPLPFYNDSARPQLPFPSQAPASHLTLHYPLKPIAPPSPAPPPAPPWLPVPGGTLAGEPQRLRVIHGEKDRLVGVDWRGEGGIAVDLLGEATNGEIWTVTSVVPLPEDLETVTTRTPSLSFLTTHMPTSLFSLLATPNLTVVLPTDQAFASLSRLERGWLESTFAEDDWATILRAHIAVNVHDDVGAGVGWVDELADGQAWNLRMYDGSRVELRREGETVSAAGVPLDDRDIFASNGVLHTVPSLLLPSSRFTLTPEKALVALNATSFVQLLRRTNLTHYVDGSGEDESAEWTILVPRDDVYESLFGFEPPDDDDDDHDGDEGKEWTRDRKRAAYHVLEGKLRKDDLQDGMLLKTELREEGLGGGKQRLKVGIGSGAGGLGWGDARVIGEPVESSNVLIYFISHLLTPPPSAVTFATSRPHLSTFVTSLYATHADSLVSRTPCTTLLAPQNDAWESAGLVSDWLLSVNKQAREDLSRVVRGHVLTDVLYAGDVASEKHRPTLEGGFVGVGRVGHNGTAIGIRVPDGGGKEGRFILREGEEDVGRDGLSRTGVVHEVDTLLVPRSVRVTLGKMARGARAEVMLGLINRAGFGWVLDGDRPPYTNETAPFAPIGNDDEDEDDEDDPTPPYIPDVPFTLLLPTDTAFSTVNLTALLSSPRALLQLVQQHLVPTPHPQPAALGGPPLALSDDSVYKTLLSPTNRYGGVVFHAAADFLPDSRRHDDNTGWLVGIQSLRGRAVRDSAAHVLRWGRTTPGPDDEPSSEAGGGGVILIDKVLQPYRPDWWERNGPALLFAALAGMAIALFWSLVVWLWRRNGKAVTYEVLEGEED